MRFLEQNHYGFIFSKGKLDILLYWELLLRNFTDYHHRLLLISDSNIPIVENFLSYSVSKMHKLFIDLTHWHLWTFL